MRRAVAIAACAVLALVVVPASTRAEEAGEGAAAREALVAERAAAAEQLAVTEGRLAEAEREVRRAEDLLVARRASREQVLAELAETERAREEPLELRRAIAVMVYMEGDPNAASLIDEVVEGGSSIERVRDRALYSAVVDWASSNIERLNARLDDLAVRLAEIEGELPGLEAELALRQEAAEAERAERDRLTAHLAALEERLRSFNRAILTGLPVDQVLTRPILIVKIDNAPAARPQRGLDVADVVFEEKVEGGMSRFAALFQSRGSDPVGPVRSARTSDVVLFANLGSPLFAYSGANLGVGGALARSALVDVGPARLSDAYYRESGRRAPHNLYSRTSGLWSGAEGGSAPQAIFDHRSEGEGLPPGARPIGGVDVSFGQTTAGFTWSAELGGWVRSTDGRQHTAAGGGVIAPANVIVRFIDYVPSSADPRSPHAVVTGSGELWVLTGGHVVTGRWEQPSEGSPTRWLDAEGRPIRLTPGRTWVLLPSPGSASLR